MSASPISKRTAPSRSFDDYILVYTVGSNSGLFPINSTEMQYMPDSAGLEASSTGSSVISLGFDFDFNGIVHNEIYVNVNGWCALIDPASTFSTSDVLTGTVKENARIKDQFVKNHVVLAPWFDNLMSVYRSADIAASGSLISTETRDLMKLGKIPYNTGIDGTSAGLKYKKGTCKNGKYVCIRWKLFAYDGATVKNNISFDLVVYENGTIEFRYAPREFNAYALEENASIGVFMWGGATTGLGYSGRYRDFGYELKKDNRGRCKNGGALYYSGFADADLYPSLAQTTYTASLNTCFHWPGVGSAGAIFKFSPPLLKRRITRKEISKLDANKFFSPVGEFDDQKIVMFNTQSISYPSGLPIDFIVSSHYPAAQLHQNLLSSGSIEISRVVTKSMFDNFLEEDMNEEEDGFREEGRPEQGHFEEQFFATGSLLSIGEIPGTFSGQLSSKEQVKMTFQVINSVQMLTNTSSIYYYNRALKQWNIPSASINDHVGPFSRFAVRTQEWDPPSGTINNMTTAGSFYAEDAKGFDAYGRPSASGSYDIVRQIVADYWEPRNQSKNILGKYSKRIRNGELMDDLTEDSQRGIQRGDIYAASKDETFEIPIDAPFLVEKVVFDIPLSVGTTWFQDRTASTLYLSSGTFSGSQPYQPTVVSDKGGPALTLSLFCQKKFGSTTIRDLIATGTITHEADSHVTVKTFFLYRGDPTDPYLFVCSPIGLDSPSATVNANNNNQFTGSVSVKTEAAISNGSVASTYILTVIDGTIYTPDSVFTPTTFFEYMRSQFARKSLSLKKLYDSGYIITNVDVFGRGMTGFTPSGGSIFGSEYVTGQGSVDAYSNIANPFYMPNVVDINNSVTQMSSTIMSKIDLFASPTGSLAYVYSFADINNSSTKRAPYLVQPGDKLVLAISKTRPTITASTLNVPLAIDADVGRCVLLTSTPLTGSSLGHDVMLSTGSIGITFYGSYVKQGSGYLP
jgi:hypothetical protein